MQVQAKWILRRHGFTTPEKPLMKDEKRQRQMKIDNKNQTETINLVATDALQNDLCLAASSAARASNRHPAILQKQQQSVLQVMRKHVPEYAMEAFGLGLFMISACTFGTLLGHPDSPIYQAIPDPMWRRLLMGMAMGLTAILNIYSPWGKQSGAHLNPATTLTFFRLGKIKGADAVFYALAQFMGGAIGVLIATLLIGKFLSHHSVNYVATMPGSYGAVVAFIAEIIITFVLISVVLRVSNNQKTARFTGLFVGCLITTYITIEDPFSGMSMNPARTLASALFAHSWTTLWIYFAAPPLGMLLAAEVYLRFDGKRNDGCAKLHHQNNKRCIHCGNKMEGNNA
jgi:aquaporin Z